MTDQDIGKIEDKLKDVNFVGNLKEKQKPAAESILSHEIGVLSLPGIKMNNFKIEKHKN